MSRWDVLVNCNWLDCESAALWDTPVLIGLSRWHFLVQKFYLGEALDQKLVTGPGRFSTLLYSNIKNMGPTRGTCRQ